jgi:6-phosphofructokinase 1
MGREAGHLAFGIGTSSHYPAIIIPEMFHGKEITMDKIIRMIISSMVKRAIMDINYGAVAISEGVFHFMTEEEIINTGIKFTFDEHGHPELGNVSKAHIYNVLLQQRLHELGIKIKSRPVEIGYEIRCCPPTAADVRYCTLLGAGVKKLYEEGLTNCIVVVKADGAIVPLYLKDVAGEDGRIQVRLVDTTTDEFQTIYKNLHFIREADYDAAKKYLPNPENYDVDKILNWKY